MATGREALGVFVLLEFVLVAGVVLLAAPVGDVVWVVPPLLLFGAVLAAYVRGR